MQRFTTVLAIALGFYGFGTTGLSRAADDDSKFMLEAASGGMMEVQLGQMAAEQASNADVRKFGERMVKDHTMANKELQAVAEKKGVAIPKELMKEHQEKVNKLKGLKGADFDREYMHCMVKDHDEDVAKFAKQAQNGKDDQVKAFAAKTLPTLKEHQQMAHDIAAKVGVQK